MRAALALPLGKVFASDGAYFVKKFKMFETQKQYDFFIIDQTVRHNQYYWYKSRKLTQSREYSVHGAGLELRQST